MIIPDNATVDQAAPGAPPLRVMFTYWGRRGAMSGFTLELAKSTLREPTVTPLICISRQNETFPAFADIGDALLPVDTFATNIGAATQSWRIPALRQSLARRIRRDRIDAVVDLMPHVWTPLIASVYRRAGARLISVIHDADAHPGDPTGAVHDWVQRGTRHADLIVTLSKTVGDRLVAKGLVPRARLATLFYPDFNHGPIATRQPLRPGEPLRLLFLGRIMPYKGLTLFLDTVDELRRQGRAIEFGIFGEGNLDGVADRLKAMDAEVVNRWLTEQEIGDATARYDVVVLSHIEASQSGVAGSALGSGIPVVATPVGGLPEQIEPDKTGLVAARADAPALAASIGRLIDEPALYPAMCAHIAATREGRSMQRFLTQMLALIGTLESTAPRR